MCLITFLTLFIGCVIITASNNAVIALRTTASVGCIISFIGTVGFACTLAPDGDPEKKVEDELKVEMYKPVQTSGS